MGRLLKNEDGITYEYMHCYIFFFIDLVNEKTFSTWPCKVVLKHPACACVIEREIKWDTEKKWHVDNADNKFYLNNTFIKCLYFEFFVQRISCTFLYAKGFQNNLLNLIKVKRSYLKSGINGDINNTDEFRQQRKRLRN